MVVNLVTGAVQVAVAVVVVALAAVAMAVAVDNPAKQKIAKNVDSSYSYIEV